MRIKHGHYWLPGRYGTIPQQTIPDREPLPLNFTRGLLFHPLLLAMKVMIHKSSPAAAVSRIHRDELHVEMNQFSSFTFITITIYCTWLDYNSKTAEPEDYIIVCVLNPVILLSFKSTTTNCWLIIRWPSINSITFHSAMIQISTTNPLIVLGHPTCPMTQFRLDIQVKPQLIIVQIYKKWISVPLA